MKDSSKTKTQLISELEAHRKELAQSKEADSSVGSSHLFGQIFQTLPFSISIKDQDGRFIFVNRAFSEMHSVKNPGWFTGRRPTETPQISLDGGAYIEQLDAKVLKSGQPAEWDDYRVRLPDGEQRTLEMYKFPLRNDQGAVDRILTWCQDITERKQAQEGLRARETQLSSITNNLPALIVYIDADERFRFVNQTCSDWFARPVEEIVGRHVKEIHGPEYEKFKPQIQTVLAGEKVIYEKTVTYPDQVHRAVRLNYVPHVGDNGKVLGFFSLVEDISERKQAEEGLRASEERFRDLVEGSREGIIIHRDFKLLFVNQAGASIFGYDSSEEMLAMGDHLSIFAPHERSRVKNYYQTRMRGGEAPTQYEFQGRRKDGSLIWLENLPRPVLWEGEPAVQATVLDITDRKQAEQELRSSQRLLRTVFDTVPAGITVRDLEGRYMMVNSNMAARYGLPAEEIETRMPDELGLPPELDEEFKHNILEVIESGRTIVSPEKFVKLPNEEGGWRQMIRAPLRSEQGEVIGVVGVGIDITERKQAEEELRSSQRLLRTVFDSVSHWVFAKDRESRYIMVNRAFAESYGMHPGDFSGKLTREVPTGTESEMERFLETDRKVIESGREWDSGDYPAHLPDGKVRVSRMYKSPMRDDEGNVVGLVGIAEDVTEQRKVEEALRENERLLQTVLDSIPHWVYVKDRESRYILVNKAMASAFNREPQDFAGAPTKEFRMSSELNFGTEDELEKLVAMDRQVIETGKPVEAADFRLTSRKGEKRYHHITKLPLLDAKGSTVGVVGVSENITQRKATEEQLRQSQKMDAVGQLAGGVAHDFNNMLQVIQGFTHLAMSDDQKPEQVAAHLQQVLKGAERAANLTRQLLAFSRQEVLQRREIDFNVLVSDLAKMVGRVIGEDIELKVSLGERPAWVFADPGMLEQLILNLCVNARDAMKEGGQLHIRTSDFHADEVFCKVHNWENPGDYVLVTVSDTGAGMPPEVRSRVFEPFFTTKEAGKGTGLGLSTVYAIVKQHQGVINLYSEEGLGTTFNIYLPSSQGQSEEGHDGEGIAREVAGGTETVLVAEDEEGVRSLVAQVLESNGYKVITARNGKEALIAFKERQDEIDLVLLDVIMPAMGGRAAFESIRALKPHVPVIFSTGYAADAIDGELLAENQVSLIRKPYQLGELYEAVREALDIARLPPPSKAGPA